jgi:hypothetical protein
LLDELNDGLLFNDERLTLLPVLFPAELLLLLCELNCMEPVDSTFGAEVFKPSNGTGGFMKRSLVRRPWNF